VLQLQTVYDERLAREHGLYRPIVSQVARKFLACGLRDMGVARIRLESGGGFGCPLWTPARIVPVAAVRRSHDVGLRKGREAVS